LEDVKNKSPSAGDNLAKKEEEVGAVRAGVGGTVGSGTRSAKGRRKRRGLKKVGGKERTYKIRGKEPRLTIRYHTDQTKKTTKILDGGKCGDQKERK